MAKKEARGSLLALTLALSFLQPGEALASSPSSGVQQESSKSTSGESVIEINDWKEPPKDIPWSKIVTIKSPFETYRAVWDQDYRGRSCFISCDYYDGLISRWTGDQLAVAQFSSYCAWGPCRKTFQNIPYGIDVRAPRKIPVHLGSTD